jgi:hypothetical protein
LLYQNETIMKDNKLEVGDILYNIQYGVIQDVVKIDRLTPKMAFSGFRKFNIELINSKAKLIGGSGFSPVFYHLETDVLKHKYKKNKLIKVLEYTDYSKYSLEELENVINILKIKI